MEQIISQVALTSATFVGRAAWSYASGLAMKKITKQIEATTGNSKKLTVLEQKLHRKLSILTPIIDSMELLQAQGRNNLESILSICDDLRSRLKTTSLSEPSEDDLTELIEMIDDLIPLVNLSLSQYLPRFDTNIISYSRLLHASSALVTGDAIMNYTTPSASIQIGSPFPIRLYSLFEGSNRKNSISDATWKEEFVKGVATIQRVATPGSRSYQLKFVEDLDDGRFHEEGEVQKINLFDVTDIVKMYYTISGKLLNIEDSSLPVLVFKIAKKEGTSGFKTDTPRATMKTEWIALELYRTDLESDDDDGDDEKGITKHLESLEINSEKQSGGPNNRAPIDSLCLLEYLIRLCSLEMREFMPHSKVDDRIFSLYFISADKETVSDTSNAQFGTSNSNMIGKSPAPTPTKRGSLLTRFLTD